MTREEIFTQEVLRCFGLFCSRLNTAATVYRIRNTTTPHSMYHVSYESSKARGQRVDWVLLYATVRYVAQHILSPQAKGEWEIIPRFSTIVFEFTQNGKQNVEIIKWPLCID